MFGVASATFGMTVASWKRKQSSAYNPPLDRWGEITTFLPLINSFGGPASYRGQRREAAASSPICDIIYLPDGARDWRWQFLIGMTYCLTLSANIWPTALIGWTVWKHRRLLKKVSHQGDGTTIAVLIILVESGALYCIIWALWVIILVISIRYPSLIVNDSGPAALGVFWGMMSFSQVHLAGIYPTITIVLACSRRGLPDIISLPYRDPGDISPMEFSLNEASTTHQPRRKSIHIHVETQSNSCSSIIVDQQCPV
ncbi:uncharacterized protein STEHIDRAFT_160151 [Stereum hirsutum FP-91666 SS1]|uniref:uncharacterized protein n=1 Tax=Stereum hirsutum (strain FP-91666) TaxID=721885 RepID=UPI0004449D50|nr:uncharacterized protein STEHIDRAFT_160151 [Stereum hirsutum FP-91666 SS1]EIM83573.1 hypothetical protein STEHIDRAFT_160151 [Stereum hirsutum FP-91666 SS1]